MKHINDHIRLCVNANYGSACTAEAIRDHIIPSLKKNLYELRDCEAQLKTESDKREWERYGMYDFANAIQDAIVTAERKLTENGYLKSKENSHE